MAYIKELAPKDRERKKWKCYIKRSLLFPLLSETIVKEQNAQHWEVYDNLD